MLESRSAGDVSRDCELLRTVVDNLPDSIFAKDENGRFILANTIVAKIIGVASPADLIGHTDAELVGGKMAEHYTSLDEGVIRDGTPVINLEEQRIDAAGEMHWDLTTKIPLRDSRGKICGLVAISRDITAQKLAEERLVAALVELRAAQAQIIEIEKFKTVGRLAVGVAHEVKNPLAIATMGLEFLAHETFPDGSAAPTVLEDMRHALSRADLIVRGLLDFSEPKQLDLAPCHLNEIIRKALAVLVGEINDTGIIVVPELQRDLPALPLDPDRITQVFVNLFTNAVHAMDGGGRLVVRTSAGQLTGVGSNVADSRSENFRVGDLVVTAQIDDTGPGIPADQLGKVFEPFYTTKPTGKGTGLGLSAVKAIVDLHGGVVRVFNRPEGGLRVELMFKT